MAALLMKKNKAMGEGAGGNGSGYVGGGGGGVAATMPRVPRKLPLTRVPRAVLGVMFGFLGCVDMVCLAALSADMKTEINVPKVLRAVRLDSAADVTRALDVVAPATWTGLHTLAVGSAAAAAAPRLGAALCLVGPSLRDLTYCGGLQLPAVPAAVWATLTTYRHVVRLQDDDEQFALAPPGEDVMPGGLPAAVGETPTVFMPALEKLELRYGGDAHHDNVAACKWFARVLSGATSPRLRVLALHIGSPRVELGNAVAAAAPHLEALAIHEGWRHEAAWWLPSLPRAHTLVLSAACRERAPLFFLAAVPALRHLQLRGAAAAQVAPDWARGDHGEWPVGALHTLEFESPQSYDGLLAPLESACATLEVLHATCSVAKAYALPPPPFARLACEYATHRVGPLLARAAPTLRELCLSAEVEDRGFEAEALALELHRCSRLQTLRLPLHMLPSLRDSEWGHARPPSLRVVGAMLPSQFSSLYEACTITRYAKARQRDNSMAPEGVSLSFQDGYSAPLPPTLTDMSDPALQKTYRTVSTAKQLLAPMATQLVSLFPTRL